MRVKTFFNVLTTHGLACGTVFVHRTGSGSAGHIKDQAPLASAIGAPQKGDRGRDAHRGKFIGFGKKSSLKRKVDHAEGVRGLFFCARVSTTNPNESDRRFNRTTIVMG